MAWKTPSLVFEISRPEAQITPYASPTVDEIGHVAVLSETEKPKFLGPENLTRSAEWLRHYPKRMP